MCKSDVRLDGKVALVTGAGSGMGFEAAKDLASRGARVIIASRNATKLERARDQIRSSTGNQNVDYRVFDLASLQSVRGLAHEISHEPRLDMLLNNAGDIGLPDVLTDDGLNLMMQVNFFSPFLLTYLLFPMLKFSAPSHIVSTGGITMYLGNIDFDHWNDLNRYNLLRASGNAKLSVFLISAEWARQLRGTGVTSNTVDPFITIDTDILRRLRGTGVTSDTADSSIIKDTDIVRRFYNQISGYLNQNIGTDALQSIWNIFFNLIGVHPENLGQELAYYASAPEMEKVSGEHFSFCKKLPPHWILKDMDLRRRLWKEAKTIVQIRPEEAWDKNSINY